MNRGIICINAAGLESICELKPGEIESVEWRPCERRILVYARAEKFPNTTDGNPPLIKKIEPLPITRAAADLIEQGWGIIANAHSGDWSKATPEWQKAAVDYREKFHALLEGLGA